MAILANNITSTDVFGNVSSQYKGNAGDHTTFEFDLIENIFFRTSNDRPITSSAVLRSENKVVFPDYLSLNGFAVGQSVDLTCDLSTGNNIVTVNIESIDYSTLIVEFDGFFAPPKYNLDLYDQETRLTIFCAELRKDLNFSFNFTNGLLPSFDTGTTASLSSGGYLSQVNPYRASQIDDTRVFFNGDMSTVIVGGGINLVQQNKKSGSFLMTVNIVRTADTGLFHNYHVTLDFINLGCIFPNAIDFNNSGIYFDLEWYSTTELKEPTVVYWNFNPSESGYFGEGYLSEQPNSTLTQAVTGPIYYNAETTHTVIIESTSGDIAMGACYVSEDNDYFTDKYETQSDLLMLLEAFGALSVGNYLSNVSPSGAQFQIEILTLTFAAGVHTIQFRFSNVNQEFIDFIESRTTLDRQINLWFTVGNTNHLAFSSDLEKEPKPTFPFSNYIPAPASEFAFFQTDSSSKTYGAEGVSGNGFGLASIADNLKLKIEAAIPKFRTYSRITFEVVGAERADTSNNFVLETLVMDLSQQVYDPSTGVTQFGISQQKANNLPSTSGFNTASLVRFSPYPDELTNFQISIFFPFLLDWKYWINQPNVPAEFYPNQNRNYINYDTANYGIFVRVLLEADNIDIEHFAPIEDIHDFNETFPEVNAEEWLGTGGVEYFDAVGNPQSILIENSLMTVKVTVDTVQPISITAGSFWGQMTIEPNEATPRWTTSSNYDNDGNAGNPFIPLTGETRLKATRVSALQATFETVIDTSGLSIGDYNITLKFMNIAGVLEQVRLEFPTEVSLPAAPQFLLDTTDECCDKFRVFADLSDPNTQHKNNATSAWFNLLGVGDSVIFEIYDSNGNLTSFQPTLFTVQNTPTAKFISFNWFNVLNTDGEGCYEIRIKYTDQFASETTTIWGVYDLMNWSIFNAKGYVSFVSQFNSNQIIDGVDFTGLNLFDTINVKGQFGNRDPKTEINNIIKNTRLVEKVTEENINEYTFISDPITSNFTDRLLDLHFLSANRMTVTDNNLYNHKKYTEKAIVIREVQSPKYLNPSNKAVINAIFGDRRMNQKSAYGV